MALSPFARPWAQRGSGGPGGYRWGAQFSASGFAPDTMDVAVTSIDLTRQSYPNAEDHSADLVWTDSPTAILDDPEAANITDVRLKGWAYKTTGFQDLECYVPAGNYNFWFGAGFGHATMSFTLGVTSQVGKLGTNELNFSTPTLLAGQYVNALNEVTSEALWTSQYDAKSVLITVDDMGANSGITISTIRTVGFSAVDHFRLEKVIP